MDKKVRVNLGGRSYDIIIGQNILRSLSSKIDSGQVIVISDPLVYKLYGSKIRIKGARKIIVPRGEKH